MNRRGLIAGMLVGAGLFAGGQLIGIGIDKCRKRAPGERITFGRVWRHMHARYIGGPRDGIIHRVGPWVQLGDTIRVPLYSKGAAFEYPGFNSAQEHATYSLHSIATGPKWASTEWVWIYHRQKKPPDGG